MKALRIIGIILAYVVGYAVLSTLVLVVTGNLRVSQVITIVSLGCLAIQVHKSKQSPEKLG